MTAPYAIIGAGPSGLATARAFADADIPFEILERHSDVGGIWDLTNPGTPMYETAHFISSRTQSAFAGFPMPADYPDYPGQRQILDYIRAFADRHGLRDRVRFGSDVRQVVPDGDSWVVEMASGERRAYGGVVAATGHNWDPILPEYPGRFAGAAYHSVHYRSPAEFAGRRVLIVGGGNSGCDIACDAATTASRTLLSLRRGYHFLPKHVFGQPTDAFFRSGPHLPAWLAQPLLTGLLRVLVGDLRRYGLSRPDHRVLETHPIMNTQILHHMAHGNVSPRPDVQELRGDRVRFADGSEEPVDVIVHATGYRPSMPYLDASLLAARDGRPPLFLNVFPERDNLFVIGLFETDGAAYPVVSKQAELVAALIRADRERPERARWFRDQRRRPRDLSGGVRYLASPRHSIYVQFDEYLHHLERLLRRMRPAR